MAMITEIKKLEKIKNSENEEEILKNLEILNKEIKKIEKETPEKLSKENLVKNNINIDFVLKEILKTHKSLEILEKVEDLLFLLKNPKVIYDELISFLEIEELSLYTFNIIFQLQNEHNFYYENFNNDLLKYITKKNIKSESFLLFLIKCTENIKNYDINTEIIKKLSNLSIEVASNECIKIIYSILVIMRIHPECFKIVNELEELEILYFSFQYIKKLIERIFIEANDISKRPKMVFLQNFSFPSIN